jgi:alginate O-acetyltransferase complex protein AlgJ
MPKIALRYAICFLIVLLAGLSLILYHLIRNGRIEASPAQSQDVYDGAISARFDEHINKFMRKTVRGASWIDGFLYWTLADAGDQVRAGEQDWLFLAEELLEVPQGDAHLRQRLRLASRLSAEFARRRVALVVLPVPDKAELARAQRGNLAVAPQAQRRLAQWQQLSGSLGLQVIDLRDGWPKPGFWRTDTHWDQSGARFAASRTAAVVKMYLDSPQDQVRLEVAPEAHARPGDLMRLANLIRTDAWFGPTPDQETTVQAVVTTSRGLLDDTPAPQVLLAGSSYSLNSGFIDFLQVALSRQIVQRSQQGSGFAGSLLDILQNHPQILKQVKVVIWEWPVRAITQPLSEAEIRYLADQGGPQHD